MALEKVCTYTFLLCLASLFSLSCRQTHGRVTRDLVPTPTPLEETDGSYSGNGTENVTDCSNCCKNFFCMYDLVVDGLRASKQFKALGNLIYLSGDEKPVFIPLKVNLTWSECNQSTSEIGLRHTVNSYIWGENPTYATFGLAQEFLQSVVIYTALINAVALFKQWVLPKVDLKDQYLKDWVTVHDQTLTVNLSGLMCSSESPALNLSLEDTLRFVTAEALTKVISVNHVMNCQCKYYMSLNCLFKSFFFHLCTRLSS